MLNHHFIYNHLLDWGPQGPRDPIWLLNRPSLALNMEKHGTVARDRRSLANFRNQGFGCCERHRTLKSSGAKYWIPRTTRLFFFFLVLDLETHFADRFGIWNPFLDTEKNHILNVSNFSQLDLVILSNAEPLAVVISTELGVTTNHFTLDSILWIQSTNFWLLKSLKFGWFPCRNFHHRNSRHDLVPTVCLMSAMLEARNFDEVDDWMIE